MFLYKKITNLKKWWFGIWRLESVPALWLGIMDIIAVPAIVTNTNTIFHTISFSDFRRKNQMHGTLPATKSIKFFFAKSKKNPHWGDFYKIMTIFSWEFQWTFLDFPGLLRLSYIVPQKIQTNFLFHPCILQLVRHSVQVLRPQSPRAHPCH